MPQPPTAQTGRMEIILDITDDAGHLSGTARAAGSGHTLTFHGAMELLASIEELCLDGAG